MPDHFKSAFEKVALAGLALRAGKFLLRGAKKAGSSLIKHPLKSAGTATTIGFGGLTALDTKNQVSKYMKTTGGTSMTSPSFNSIRR